MNKILDLEKVKCSWPDCLGRAESIPAYVGVKLEAGLLLTSISLVCFLSWVLALMISFLFYTGSSSAAHRTRSKVPWSFEYLEKTLDEAPEEETEDEAPPPLKRARTKSTQAHDSDVIHDEDNLLLWPMKSLLNRLQCIELKKGK